MRPAITYAVTGEGPDVLLLHGLGGDRQQALGLLSDDVHATRIAPDMPGHGNTDLVDDEQVTFAAFATLTADLLDTLQQQEKRPAGAIPVVGVSMGVGIASTLAATRPDLVERLVLIRPSWLDLCPPPNLAPFPLIARLIDTLGPDAGSDAFRATPEYLSIKEMAPAMSGSLLGQFTRPYAAERSRVLAEMPNDLPLPGRDAYGKLNMDTLVVAAPRDPVHPEHLARALCSWIPHARLAIVPRRMPDATEHQLAVQRIVAAALASPHLAKVGS
jgi:pimeloyl-ACP methyl ester carboxylesterase